MAWTPRKNRDGQRTRIDPDTGVFEIESPSPQRLGLVSGTLSLILVALLGYGAFHAIATIGQTSDRMNRAMAEQRGDDARFRRALEMAEDNRASFPLREYLQDFPEGKHVEEAIAAVYAIDSGRPVPRNGPTERSEALEQAHRYPRSYQRSFQAACLAQGASEPHCACVWDAITRELTVAEFEDVERTGATHPLAAQVAEMNTACASAPPTTR